MARVIEENGKPIAWIVADLYINIRRELDYSSVMIDGYSSAIRNYVTEHRDVIGWLPVKRGANSQLMITRKTGNELQEFIQYAMKNMCGIHIRNDKTEKHLTFEPTGEVPDISSLTFEKKA